MRQKNTNTDLTLTAIEAAASLSDVLAIFFDGNDEFADFTADSLARADSQNT
jgi:hypothetical protein